MTKRFVAEIRCSNLEAPIKKFELSGELQDHPTTASLTEYIANKEESTIQQKILGFHDTAECHL